MTTDEVPGVILRFRDAHHVKNASGRKLVKVTLEAEVNDEAIWEAAQAKLKEGLKVYTAADFQTELLDALRRENVELESKLRHFMKAFKDANADNVSMRAALSVLHRDLETG